MFDDITMIESALQEGDDIEQKIIPFEFCRTPLMWAVFVDRPISAEILIEKGANMYARDYEEKTPLHIAAMEGRVDIVELLSHHGPDAMFMVDKYGNLPWTHAFRSFHMNSRPSMSKIFKDIADHLYQHMIAIRDETRQRELAFAMITNERLGHVSRGHEIHQDIIREILHGETVNLCRDTEWEDLMQTQIETICKRTSPT